MDVSQAVAEALDNTGAPVLPDSRKRKREELVADSAAADSVMGTGDLRFNEGQRVVCNISKRSRGFLWKAGTISAVSHEIEGSVVPYVVELENGQLAGTPEDDDECIRLAARAHLDTRVMRVFAVPKKDQRAVLLRFSEGDRVAVQLDVGNWEEGVVIEVWAAPERNGDVFKTWAGVAVPYAVRLDLGEDVLVPFDTDEVIRAESSARPPQKSIEEQIGGTARKPAAGGKRFVKHQTTEGKWVCRDTRTGIERPCGLPDSDDDD